ncbi:hypothetical protein M8J76_000970 [Diaphorina citri]|nr:hypothetical protein M8J76_000970 [Diaphorina citri]
MDFTPADELHSTMVPVYKDRRFCDCTTDSCDCGEALKEYEWVWDTNSADPETIVLSCQNRETLFHPRSSQGTTAIRGTTPFKSGHVYYWEVKMLSTLYGTDVVVGVGTKNAMLNTENYCSLVGNDKESWGYSYWGRRHHNGEEWSYGNRYDQGSIIGVKLDMWNGNLEFYLNRKPLGVAFTRLNKYPELYPIVSSTAAKSSIRMIHSTSHPASLMHHCLASLRDHFQETKQLSGIPSLKHFTRKSWWTFTDDEALYPDGERKKDYHWFLDEDSPQVSLANLLRWNMRRRVQRSDSERPPWRLYPILY